jgi:hypothetical protein
MENFLKVVGAVVLLAFVAFLMPLIGIIFGAFAGWVVSLFWPATMAKIALVIGVAGTPGWQLGAGLGFVGSFFKTSVQQTKS